MEISECPVGSITSSKGRSRIHLTVAIGRVQHGYGNTRGVSKTGHTGSGTVSEFDNCGYTLPVTAVSRCHTVI